MNQARPSIPSRPGEKSPEALGAPEVLLERLEDALQVEVVRKPLHSCDTLAPTALLHSNMDLGLVAALFLRVGEGVCIQEGGKQKADATRKPSFARVGDFVSDVFIC